MRVCVLSDEVIADFDPSSFLHEYEWEMVTLTAPVMDKVRALAESKKFDIFLNVCEGYEFEDEEDDLLGYEAIEVVEALGEA